ncbi:MAG: PAS-domain containing protein [Litoreibacter sp.]
MFTDSPEVFLTISGLAGLLILLSAHAGIQYLRREQDNVKDAERGHVFTFQNRELIAASPAAREALNVEDLDEDIYHQMIFRLSDIFPELEEKTINGDQSKTDFTLKEVSIEGPMSVTFTYEGTRTIVTINGIAAPLSRKMIMDRDQILAVDAELRTLRGTVETAPFPMWRESGAGSIDWVNRAYLGLLDNSDNASEAGAWPPPRLFESGTIVKLGEPPVSSRKSVKKMDGTLDWYDISGFGIGENSLHFAVNANATTKAEESQRNFLQTLTQTFSYLSTGLAVFDKNRQLIVFNPSLTDLTSLEPHWLASRPTLYDFINQLRENRVLPERKNFTDWRSKVSALERSAREGTYCETWSLPNGQTYRMTGKPHPEGAIAFLFEDITASIALTRQFRQQLDLNKLLFDALPQALVVFGSDGKVALQNQAYSKIWGLDGSADTQDTPMSIVDATRLWQGATHPTPIWGDAREFVLSGGERTEWNDTISLNDGRLMCCRCAPLAGGASMVSFEEYTENFILPHLRSGQTAEEIALDAALLDTVQSKVKSA